MSHQVPQALIKAVEPYVYGRYSSIPALYGLARHVAERGIPGDYVECGVARGGSAAIVGAALADEDHHLWLYDSFEGLPEPTEEDGGYATGFVGEYRGSIADVHNVMGEAGVPLGKIKTVAGWFDDTLRPGGPGPERICFLHIDADWYGSVLMALRRFYDAVSPGGIVLLDDFAWFEGARKAFYAFTAERGIAPLVERFGRSQLFWIKDKEHNRDLDEDPPYDDFSYPGKWAPAPQHARG